MARQFLIGGGELRHANLRLSWGVLGWLIFGECMGIVTEFIQEAPAWVIGPVCVLGFVVPAMVGLWLVHRGIHQRIKLGETLIDNGVVGWFFSGSLTIYGITLGLIAISTWERSSDVAGIASREAATIAALYRDTSGFASPLREELHGKLREYTRFVIEKAWPAQRRGEILNDGNRLLDAFQSRLFVNEPKTDGGRMLQAEALKTFNELVGLRRQRTEAVNQGVPEVVWVVILLGGALTIATSFCFQVQQFRFHLLLTTGLAAMIGLLVFLIAALDRPYRGAVSVDPTAYQIVLETITAKPD
jgi:hypothetical protein